MNTKFGFKNISRHLGENASKYGIISGLSLLSILPISEGLKHLSESSAQRGGSSMFTFQVSGMKQKGTLDHSYGLDLYKNTTIQKSEGQVSMAAWHTLFTNDPLATAEFIVGSMIAYAGYKTIKGLNQSAESGFAKESQKIYGSMLEHLDDALFSDATSTFQKKLSDAIEIEAKNSVKKQTISPTKDNLRMAKQALTEKGIAISTLDDFQLMSEYSGLVYKGQIDSKISEIRSDISQRIRENIVLQLTEKEIGSEAKVQKLNLEGIVKEAVKNELELRYGSPKYGLANYGTITLDAVTITQLETGVNAIKSNAIARLTPIFKSNKYSFMTEYGKLFKAGWLKPSAKTLLFVAGAALSAHGAYQMLEAAFEAPKEQYRQTISSMRTREMTPQDSAFQKQIKAVKTLSTQDKLVPYLSNNLTMQWNGLNLLVLNALSKTAPDWPQRGWKTSNFAFYKFDSQSQTVKSTSQTYGAQIFVPPMDKGNLHKLHAYFGIQAIEPTVKGVSDVFLPEVAFKNGKIYFGADPKSSGVAELIGEYDQNLAGKKIWVSITISPPGRSQFENGSAIISITDAKSGQSLLKTGPIELKENFKTLLQSHSEKYEFVPSMTLFQ